MNRKVLLIIVTIIVILVFGYMVLKLNEPNNDNEDLSTNLEDYNNSGNNELSGIDFIEYYKDNENINRFINIYNKLYPDNLISKEDISVYHHNGRDHKEQVQLNINNLEVKITGSINSYDNKTSVFIKNNTNADSDKILRDLIKRVVKVYNVNIKDERIDEYLNNQQNSSDINTYDGIEYLTNKNNNIIEYIKITGDLK